MRPGFDALVQDHVAPHQGLIQCWRLSCQLIDVHDSPRTLAQELLDKRREDDRSTNWERQPDWVPRSPSYRVRWLMHAFWAVWPGCPLASASVVVGPNGYY